MKTAVVIAEYNPFHNGHKYHIEKTREVTHAENVVVIMSGNYVQRGEPAICDKYVRTRCALENGADMVIELPFPYACASSEIFAFGAVSLAHETRIADCICFGSECGDLPLLNGIADAAANEGEVFRRELKRCLEDGVSFAKARANALKSVLGNGFELRLSNDILAVDYLKTLKNLGSALIPFTVKRTNDYNSCEIEGSVASATAIRKAITDGDYAAVKMTVPPGCLKLLEQCLEEGSYPVTSDMFSDILRYRLMALSNSELAEIADISEGIENRMTKLLPCAGSFSGLVSAVKTKRYSQTRIQRALMHVILGITDRDLREFAKKRPPYIRVLGFKKTASKLLSEMERRAELPVITNIPKLPECLDARARELLDKEITATDIYNSVLPKKDRKKGYEYSQPLIVIDPPIKP